MKLMIAVMASFLIGCLAWIMDITGMICKADSWIQLHGIWHIAMAAAIWFLYLYYRSERTDPAKNLIE